MKVPIRKGAGIKCERTALWHALPVFTESDGAWIMLNEANVLNTNGSYCSCHLVGNENGCMTIGFCAGGKGRPIRTSLPFHSPGDMP